LRVFKQSFLMGNVCGGDAHVVAESNQVNQFNSHDSRRLPRQTHASAGLGVSWEGSFPAISRVELVKRREEFWDTRIEGKAEMWQAIRMSAEAGDASTAAAIMDSAGLTPYDIDKADSCYCYDQLGNRYEVPMFVLYEPSNLLDDNSTNLPKQNIALDTHKQNDPRLASSQSKEDTVECTSSSKSIASPVKGEAGPSLIESVNTSANSDSSSEHDEKKEARISFKVRLSSGQDISVTMKPTDSISEMKRKVAQLCGTPANKQKVIYRGKLLPDVSILKDHAITNKTVVQVMALP